jgi:hypothetical protein
MCHLQTHAVQQIRRYSITSSASVCIELGYLDAERSGGFHVYDRVQTWLAASRVERQACHL